MRFSLRNVFSAVLLLVAFGGNAPLQADEPALVPSPEQGLLEAAGQGVFDQKGEWHVSDRVHLVIPGTLELWCEDFTIKPITDAKGHRTVERIVARTNVVMFIVGSMSGGGKTEAGKAPETNRVSAFQAVFEGTQGTVEATGQEGGPQPRLEGPETTVRADRLVFDRARQRFAAYGNYQQVFNAKAIQEIMKSTNAPAPAGKR
jgi:hypothetical protein